MFVEFVAQGVAGCNTFCPQIDCRFFLTVADYTDNVVKGDIQVQSTRPVYNSAYTTTVLNFKDKNVEFSYQQGEPLTFTVNTMASPVP